MASLREPPPSGGHNVEIGRGDESRTLSVEAGETIFAAALRDDFELPFSCVSGYCGACIATLEEGEVEMRVNQHLSKKQLDRGLILTCQAVPKSVTCRIRFID
jgi:ferredoxin